MYHEELLEYFRYPKYTTLPEGADFQVSDGLPSCGDQITLAGCVQNGQITAIGFTGKGCVISQATASMLTEYAFGKPATELLALSCDDLMKMLGLELGPVRMKCALLSLHLLKQGLASIT